MNIKFIIISFIVLISILWFLLPINYLIHFTSDDTYFYLKTALNFSSGKGSSFDGINLTNGYHPLWFLILSFYYFVIGLLLNTSPELLLRLTFVFITILNGLSVYLLIKIVDKLSLFKSKFTLYGFIIITLPFTFFYVIGSEKNIIVLLFILYSYFFVNDNDAKNIYWKARAIILALIFLSRIDLGIISGAILILFELRFLNKTKIFSMLVIFISTVLIYAFVNKMIFNVYSSISSKYKFSLDVLSNLQFFPTPLSNPIDFGILSLFVFGGLAYFVFIKFYKPELKRNNLLEILFVISFLFLLSNFLLNKQGVREWYYIFPFFTSLILFFTVVDKLNLARLLFYMVVIVTGIYFTLFRINYYNHNSAYSFAKELNQKVKESEIVFQIDYSGIIGFFSERTVVNGDGLINSYDYYKVLKNNQLMQYLKVLNPDYFIFYNFDKENDHLFYTFKTFHNYEFRFDKTKLRLKHSLLYGGIFRKKYGNFYLVHIKDYFK